MLSEWKASGLNTLLCINGKHLLLPSACVFRGTDSSDLHSDMVDMDVLKLVVRTFLLELVRYRTSLLLPTKHTKDLPAV